MPQPRIQRPLDPDLLLVHAVDAAFAAGKVIRKHYSKKIEVREKPGLGLVTNADFEAERVALRILKKAQPGFALLTEETNARGTMGPRDRGLWIVDPLDGTTNFVHRFPMFCVTIAAQIQDQVQVAVTYHPILDELYTAVRGGGAFINGKKMKVSTTTRINDALLSTGFTYKKKQELREEMSAFEKLSGSARAVRRPGSAALDLAYTARGVFDGFWERHLSPWDVAAGALLVTESGGKVSDFLGQKFTPYGREVLATNGILHNPIVKRIQDS